ncbi:conjugal transfer protein TraO [Pseudomonas syringae]|uniref:conjugal transfer protein TraO n=1 Tax=Pseudomonas ovata TaxID=1839709 RepID=UPI000D69639B|nr:conjugal transfer protein TraO [Pseudomonas ovata]MBD8792722.1 conjugal transfer protein TraO [Pseudomonas syringae]MBD8803245.1 conjugal transfer protein TraO [Pseudomonas syringae]MBD8814065.1 conjugal transfer protein TraO [Pseudomonas syringae]
MAIEEDAGRATKLTLGIGVALVAGVAIGGYALWGWYVQPPAPESNISLERVAGTVESDTEETPAYRGLLEQYNRNGVQQAQAQNESFIASMPMAQEPIVIQPRSEPPPLPDPEQEALKQTQASTPLDERKLEALSNFLKRLEDQRALESTGLQTARLLGESGDSYLAWSESLNGGRRNTAMTANTAGSAPGATGYGADSPAPVEVIAPYWRGPGEIDIGIDSDNSTTPVLARINTGKHAGIVLKASDGAKLTGEGVVIHFTEMAYKGVNYKVDAYALQEDSLLANVASDVNHRYMSRIVLPALLNGIGSVGELYSQANTEVISNGFSTEVVRPGLPDGAAVLGSMAGGAASQAAKVLSEDAARVPATQVTVTKGQVVAIQFMRGVYSGDAIAPGEGGDTVKASIPLRASTGSANSTTSPANPTTPEQWRAAARSQIQAQQQLLERNQ